MASNDLLVVGIDYGYSAIRVAVFEANGDGDEGTVDIVHNDHGNDSTPNVIALDSLKALIGEDAATSTIIPRENIVFGIKKLIGRLKDDTLDEELQSLPFVAVISNEKVKVILSSEREKKILSPEEIASFLFAYVQSNVERCLNREDYAVKIAVPANFRNSQRQSMLDAASIAGIKDATLVNDTVALASLFLWQNFDLQCNKLNETNNLLVVCVGAAFTSISVMNYSHNCLQVKQYCGLHFGGNDIDKCLQTYLSNNLSLNEQQTKDLLVQCEACKIYLSSNNESTIVIDELMDGFNHVEKISEEYLNYICEELFNSLFNEIKETVLKANIDMNKINHVLLAGGSTNIPKIKHFLSNSCTNAAMHSFTDESVSFGASLLSPLKKKRSFNINEVSSFGYAIRFSNESILIPKHSKLPLIIEADIRAEMNKQRYFYVNVFELDENSEVLIGDFVLQTNSLLKKGNVAFVLRLNIDNSAVVNILATEAMSSKKFTLHCKSRLRKDDLQRMVVDAQQMKESLLSEKQRFRAKQAAMSIICEYETSLNDLNEFFGENIEKEAKLFVNSTLDWIKKEEYSSDQYNTKAKEVEDYFDKLLQLM